MIYYKTNQNWFGDVRHLATSWTMVRIVRSVIGIGLYATVLCVITDYFNWESQINMNTSVFSLLGVMLSILLVFRTNTAYDRWWEGRKQWGALVNNTRNFAIYIHAMFPKEDREVRHFMAVRFANFAIALVEHLRNGVHLEKLVFLSKTEKAVYESKSHVPNQIALEIFDRIAESRRRGDLSEGDYINMKAQHESLLDIVGACERIKKTPIPFSYAVYLKIFISAYALMLPFALLTTFHYSTIPLSMLLSFALLGVELLGEEIEDPFGLDCNDLPTGDIAHTIKKNVFELLEQKHSELEERERQLYEKVF